MSPRCRKPSRGSPSGSTTRCSTTCRNGWRGPGSPISSTTRAGSTARRSRTCASSWSTGRTGTTGAREEARLNRFEHFRTRIDGQSIHFVHARSRHADALPLLLVHGWPGSVVEFLDVIPRLTDPEAHGGRADDAFHVIAPSLPGYGFSEPPRTPGWDVRRIAQAFVELMARLRLPALRRAGRRLGRADRHQDRDARPRALRRAPPQHADRRPARRSGRAHRRGAGRPRGDDALPAHGSRRTRSCREASRRRSAWRSTTRPPGLLSWIVEKFRTWSDCDGDPEQRLHPRPAAHQRDALLGDADVHVVGAVVLGDHAQRGVAGAAGARRRPDGRSRATRRRRCCASRVRGSSSATT